MRSGNLSLGADVSYRNVVDGLFLRTAMEEGLTSILGSGWVTRSSLDDLRGEILADASYFHSATEEALVRVSAGIAHVILSERSVTVRAAGRDRAAATAVRAAIASELPEADGDEREVPVRFWWWQPQVARNLARMLPALPWATVEHNYTESTRASLREMVNWREGPPPGGRLILWHGAPGTGKTTAVRALAGEWRSWVQFQFVTDPEQFLSNPSYLLETIADARRPDSGAGPLPWKVVVLEDSGEYLAPDAKHTEGQALSRLLNVCDGVLGQAMRALVLVTTNEPVRCLHPALSRPGRCLAEVSFDRFDRAGLEEWAAGMGVEPPDGTSATLADLYAHLEGRASYRDPRPAYGFAAAGPR